MVSSSGVISDSEEEENPSSPVSRLQFHNFTELKKKNSPCPQRYTGHLSVN